MKQIILLRHGESRWNLENRFTGWTDVDLTDRGREEARKAGRAMLQAGLQPRWMFTSVLRRAIHTLQIAACEMQLDWVPAIKDWHLNERFYGALQGLYKSATAERYGAEQVHLWRRSFDAQPPLITPDDPRFPGHDPRYASLTADELPLTESLRDTIARVRSCWEEKIVPRLHDSDCVLIAAHGNSLRALAMLLLHLTASEVIGLEIPTGKPWVFTADDRLDVQSAAYL
ncbi:2,3-diphosphoglycerate-dependent phosphoglycerate mutase [Paramuribaculum intestinale]|uniref:2,3-diphosphoglycerate-dependent phosphoglycerate mutase n=1 Tax=Paramuribaculum intestinale TaxID=2094151 RepID=UPI0025B22B61|nr:2,3-diphosphoglycerate-dependent phosphoglycerate mutase [Paramuribaculum intestinale]